MVGLPHQRMKLHDGDEAAKILHFLSLILTIHHSRQVEQLGPLMSSSTALKTYFFLNKFSLTMNTSMFQVLPDRPQSKIDVWGFFWSFLVFCCFWTNQGESKHPLSGESHGPGRCWETQTFPSQSRSSHQSTLKPGEKCQNNFSHHIWKYTDQKFKE